MKCPKCGHIMQSYREDFPRDKKKPFWICADLFCRTVVEWDNKRDGEYTG